MGKAVARVLLSPISAAVSLISPKAGAALFNVIATAAAFIPGVGPYISAGLQAVNAATGAYRLGGGRGGGLVPFDPKSINPDKSAPRKIVFGRTAFPMDLLYAEPSADSEQEYIDYVFVLAAHKSEAIEAIHIEDKLAWTAAGGAQGIFAGYLTVEIRLEAGAGATHTVNAGTVWNSSTRMTGCTTMKVRVKRSRNSKTSQSPFASGIYGRWTVIGKGMPLYDPARDSTVPGGSGTQRAADCATWAYVAGGIDRGNNPALQLLAYLLGWRINGTGSVGLGMPAARLNLASFATAAAICDESVALAGGGSHRRYEGGKAYTDADDPGAVIAELLAAMNGELVHDGGRLALRLAVNDLTPEVTLTEDDFLSGFDWAPHPDLSEQFTVVRGRFAQPDAPALFSLVDYPDVATGRPGLAPRVLTLELPNVQDIRRAERIATQVARRSARRGEFTVTLGIRGWLLRQNMVVAVTAPSRGWTAKLFRVRGIVLATDGSGNVDVRLREEDAAIYSWATSETGNVAPVAPVPFDSRLQASWLMAGIAPEATRNLVDGTTLDQSGDTILVKTAGVNTPQLAPNATTVPGEFSATGSHTISAAPTWGSVVLSSSTAQVTLANDSSFAASVVLQWVVLCQQAGASSDSVDFRMVHGSGPTALGMIYTAVDVSGGGGRSNAIPLTFRDTIPANTTRTYTLQARSNDTTTLVQATCDARMDKRT